MTLENMTELAYHTNVSKSAVHRFCKRIGFHAFDELKVAISKDLAEARSNIVLIDVNYSFKAQDRPQLIAKKLSKLYATVIRIRTVIWTLFRFSRSLDCSTVRVRSIFIHMHII